MVVPQGLCVLRLKIVYDIFVMFPEHVIKLYHCIITFSDEAHFSLNGYVNRKNLRFLAGNNPIEIMEVPLYTERVTIWYTLMQGRIFGPLFFENEEEKAVTVNVER